MNNDKKTESEAAQSASPAPEVADGAQPQPPGADARNGTEPAAKASEVDLLKAEVAELKDRLQRTHAEMDNVRKRLEREKADTAKFAITKFAQDVVGIGDNVQRAMDAVPHAAAEQDPALKSFVEGVTMIEREMLSVLGRHGVKRIDPKGEMFNPHHHQAVLEAPAPNVPSGTITQVFQAGYMIEERVLRPAMVAVAKGGLRPQPPPAAAVEAPEGATVGEADAPTARGDEPPKPDGAAGTGSV